MWSAEGDQLIQNPRIGSGPVGSDLGRDRAAAQRADEEPPGRCQVAALGQQYAKDLAMPINRPVQVGPPAGDLHVSLVGEPPVAGSVTAGARRLDELGSEPLDPPVNGDVIHGDTALSERLLHVAVRQAVPQVPPDRDRDHLWREPEASKHRGLTRRRHRTSLPHAAIGQRNTARCYYRTPVRLRQLLRLVTLCSGESNARQPAEPVARSRSCAGEPGGRAVGLATGLLLSSGRRPPRAGPAGRWRWRAGCCRPGWPPRSCRHRCWPSTGGWHPPPPRTGCAGQ
jgi:hypothetical protein